MTWSLALLPMVTKVPPVQEPRKGREGQDTRKGGKFPLKLENQRSLIVTTIPLKVPVKPKMKEYMFVLLSWV